MKKTDKTPKEIKEAFDEIFSFTDEEMLEIEGKMIEFEFISEVYNELDRQDMDKEALADKMGISPDELTMIFTGEKPLTHKHRAMIQRVLGVRFRVIIERPKQTSIVLEALQEVLDTYYRVGGVAPVLRRETIKKVSESIEILKAMDKTDPGPN